MISQEFEFHAPATFAEALELLAENGRKAKILAGGMSMVPAMNLGIARPTPSSRSTTSLGSTTSRDDGDRLRIGAMVRHARIASRPADRRASFRCSRRRHRRHRRRAGPEPRHARRQRRARRPGGRLPAGPRRARRDARGRATADGSDRSRPRLLRGRDGTALEPTSCSSRSTCRSCRPGAASAYVRLARRRGQLRDRRMPRPSSTAGLPAVAIGGTTGTAVRRARLSTDRGRRSRPCSRPARGSLRTPSPTSAATPTTGGRWQAYTRAARSRRRSADEEGGRDADGDHASPSTARRSGSRSTRG